MGAFRGLVVDVDMGVDAQREADVAVAGQRLGHLGTDADALQAGDKQVAVAVEVGEQTIVILVATVLHH